MRMKVAALALLASVSMARAQTPGFYVLKDQSSPQQTLDMGIFTTAGKSFPGSISVDSTGNPLAGAAGTTNPNNTALFMQGVTGGVPLSVTFPSAQHIICDSGCSGGGGGGTSSNFGSSFPTAGTALGVSNGTNMVAVVLGQQVSGASLPVVLPAAQITALTPPTSVGITGTLPGYAATPTFNIGTAPTIAVSGTFWQATQPVSAASLPLPAGAATQTTSAAILTALGSPFQAGSSIGNTSFGISGTLPAFAVTPTFNIGTAPTITVSGPVTANAGTNLNTSLLAVEGGGHLASIDTKTPALGQALAAASVPVVLTTAQISTLTPLSSVTVTQSTGTNLHMVCDSGCSSSSSPSFGTTFPTTGTPIGMSQGGNLTAFTGTSGSLNVNLTNASVAVTGTFFQTTQPVSIATMPSTPVTGTFWPYTLGQQVSGSSVPVVLPAAQITTLTPPAAITNYANETGGNLATIVTNTGRIPAQGQALAAASLPVVLTALQVTALTPPAAITGFALDTSVGTTNTDLGALGSTACATDNGSCNLNALLQRTNQRVTSLITALASPFQAGGSIGNTTFAATQATAANLNATVVGTGTLAVQLTGTTNNINNIAGTISLPTGASTAANQTSEQAPVAFAAAAATKSVLVGAQYLSTQPTVTNTQQGSLLTTARGEMLVSPGVSGFPVTLASTTVTGTVAVTQSTSPWIVAGGGTAGTPGTAVMAVQGVSGGTAVPISGSVSISGAVALNTTPTLANGNGVVPTQGGAVLSATNGWFGNILQGNAVLSATNPSFASITDGTNKAAVKAASTAAAATDPSLVTNESPNSQLSVAVGTTVDAPCTLPATTTACSDTAIQKAIANAANSPLPIGSASGGIVPKTLAALSNTAVTVKSSAGQVYRVQCYNPDASNSAAIELFNTTSVTLGTTTVVDFVEIGPGSNTGFTHSLVGEQFSTAIAAAAVKTIGGSTAPTTALDCTVGYN